MKKKVLSVAVCCATAGLIFAGCGSSGETAETTTEEVIVETVEETTSETTTASTTATTESEDLADVILGEWELTKITTADNETLDIADYLEQESESIPDDFDITYTFEEDGKVIATFAGLDSEGEYTIDDDKVTVIFDTAAEEETTEEETTEADETTEAETEEAEDSIVLTYNAEDGTLEATNENGTIIFEKKASASTSETTETTEEETTEEESSEEATTEEETTEAE